MRLASGSRLISSPLPHSSLRVMEQFNGSVEEPWAGRMETWTSRYRDSARPSTSKPGPMLADEQGVRMTKLEAVMGGSGSGWDEKITREQIRWGLL